MPLAYSRVSAARFTFNFSKTEVRLSSFFCARPFTAIPKPRVIKIIQPVGQSKGNIKAAIITVWITPTSKKVIIVNPTVSKSPTAADTVPVISPSLALLKYPICTIFSRSPMRSRFSAPRV